MRSTVRGDESGAIDGGAESQRDGMSPGEGAAGALGVGGASMCCTGVEASAAGASDDAHFCARGTHKVTVESGPQLVCSTVQ